MEPLNKSAMTQPARHQRGEIANPALRPPARFGLWCLAALLALAVHAGGGVLLAQWHPAPVATAAPVMARIITRQPEPAALPLLPTPPIEVNKPPPKAVLAAKPEPIPALRPAPTPVAVAPPSPVVAPILPAPATTPAPLAPAATAAPPPVRELAAHCPRRPAPAYPAAARRRGLEGRVQLKVALAATGVIDEITVSESSGSPLLDEAAMAAVRRWRCKPARIDGKAVSALALQRITFHLQ